jgi:tetratricopeptide (TPR) repeat protein
LAFALAPHKLMDMLGRAGAYLAGVLLCVGLILPAGATGFTEMNAAISAENHGSSDVAIQHATAALAASDLAHSFVPLVHVVRGNAQLKAKRYHEAQLDYDAALRLRPDWYQALLLRSFVFLEQNNIDGALADLTHAVAVEPDKSQAYAARAVIYMVQRKFDAAAADCARMLTFDPDVARQQLLCGNVYRGKGDSAAALQAFNTALDLDPNNVDAYFDRGALYEATGELDKAIKDLRQGLEKQPSNFDGRLELGLVEWESGAFDDAVRDLETLHPLNPAHPYALLWRSITRLTVHKSDDDLRTEAAKTDAAKWPAPLIAYYLGDKTADQAVAGAKAGAAEGLADRVCEANFYVGIWQALHGQAGAAKPLLADAATHCPVVDIERNAAAAALKHRW